MALGALIIKEKLGTSDRETVEQIRENPYLQYFIGFSSYSNEIPFDASLLVHFRQRISVNLARQSEPKDGKKNPRSHHHSHRNQTKKNQKNQARGPLRGKLLLCDLRQRGHYLPDRYRYPRARENANRKNRRYPLRVNQTYLP